LAAEAASIILGYTCANDVSNRDLQLKDKQFTRAKSFDTYKPMGPWIETELDPDTQSISLRQNDVVRQDSVTSDMIFPTPFIIEFISSIMTLEPGDVIITGTPSGVGPMKSGDRIEIRSPASANWRTSCSGEPPRGIDKPQGCLSALRASALAATATST